jgi:CheY-like chemotaxis protein
VRIEVSDSGQGMTAETRQRIFEPFFTTRGDSAGRGLGLAVVYGIVAQSGGYLEVESTPGEGSVITIFLPLTSSVEARVSAPDEAATVQHGATVLLAEDEDAVRRLARRILEREGFYVIESRDGAEELELLERAGTRVDLVLSDVVMPRMGGRELVERCLARFPDARAVLMSGYTDDDLVRADAIGNRASFLPKPFTPQALVLKVREALEAVRQ